MRCRSTVLLCLAFLSLLLLPAVCTARAAADTGGHRYPDPPVVNPVYGAPWTGSYLQMVPASKKTTKTRIVWVKYLAVYNTWADGGENWEYATQSNIGLRLNRAFGDVAKVLATQFISYGRSYDPQHAHSVNYYRSEKLKMRLKAGNGKKKIKVNFSMVVIQPSDTWPFTPAYPLSPTYSKTVKLAI